MIKRIASSGFIMLFVSTAVFTQEVQTAPGSSPVIQDNSFLVEEAFNQEERVVQHIFNAMYFRTPQEDLAMTFTQEWPLFSLTHQISYTVPYAFLNSNATNGIGDVLINYRYQVCTQDKWAAIAPRLSIILATGNAEAGLGAGTIGVQTNIAASKQLSESFITHANAGMTLLPHVKGATASGGEVKRTLTSCNLGSSIIWLAHSNVNCMLEFVYNYNSEIDDGEVTRSSEYILNPGIRFAINVERLQIVPGLGVPIRFDQDGTHTGVFSYLSFEHPF